MTSARREPRRVEKPWGHELIWAETEHYVGKLLFVRAGHALSLQYHEVKDESWYVQSGTARLELGTVGGGALETRRGRPRRDVSASRRAPSIASPPRPT